MQVKQALSMNPNKKPLQSILFDAIWPYQGLCPDPEASKRHYAIATVLQRIPEAAYIALQDKADQFSWFIPDVDTYFEGINHALLYPFPVTTDASSPRQYATVLYLSPAIERHSLGFAVAVVAHELAHIFRNHAVTGISQEQYEAQEAEAWQAVKEWGFEKEKRAYDRFCERFMARRQKTIHRLRERIDSRRRA